MTQFIIHDTVTLLRDFYTSTARSSERFARVNEVLLTPDGLLRLAQAGSGTSDAYSVMTAGMVDGGAALGQQGFGLFNPTRKAEASALIFDRFETMDILTRIERDLKRFAEAIPDDIGEVNVLLFPIDPANRAQMLWAYGISGVALTPGCIVMQFFPSLGNLTRLSALLARWLVHHKWITPKSTPKTLRDWLAMEGSASRFVEAMIPNLPYPAWMNPFHPAADWDDTLQAVAALYGLSSYSEMKVNTYGQNTIVGDERPPFPKPLDADMRELVESVITDSLDETTPHRIASILYGDEIIAAQGYPGLGLPPFAGYEIAHLREW